MNLASLVKRAKEGANINQLLRSQLLWMLLLRIVLYTMLLAIGYVFPIIQPNVTLLPPSLFNLLLLIVYSVTIGSAFFLLLFQGSLRNFAFAQNLLDTFFAANLVFFSGASSSNFTSVFFFPIIAGGLILPRKGGLVAAAASTLQYGALLCFEVWGYYPDHISHYVTFIPKDVMVVVNHFAVQGLVFFLAAMLSALFGLRLKKTENALHASLQEYDRLEVLYKQIFDNISTGIITIDATSRITSSNNAASDITGYDPHELNNQPLRTFFPDLHTEESRNHRHVVDFIRKDGSIIRLGYSSMPLTGIEPSHGTTDSATADKIITLRDISDIEKLERQVRQTEKLAAIGMMSASIAHDFRNPLTAISGSAQLLALEFSKGGTQDYSNYQLTRIIEREAGRLIHEISDFLKFARPENAQYSWFSLRSCANEVIEVCRAAPTWPTTADISLEIPEQFDIYADEKQIFTVLSHLLTNAIAFCPTGKERLSVEAWEEMPKENTPTTVIQVSDNGPGIEEEKKELVFEPFYTSRADGTGLGLAIVRQIIEEHQGTIEVACESNGLSRQHPLPGASFIMRLPLPL